MPTSRSNSPKLALGTVQFGLPYGILNIGKPTSQEQVGEILRVAWSKGIDLLDTASSYGNAERIIGEARPQAARFGVVSKIPKLDEVGIGNAANGQLVDCVRKSLDDLKLDRLAGLLVHDATDLLGTCAERLFGELLRLKSEGVVRRIGVSVYDPDTLMAIVERFPVEIVQLPLNVLDQRFAKTGVIADLSSKGVEIHVRSVFLQGALIADVDRLPKRLVGAKDAILRFQNSAEAQSVSPVEAALSFVARCDGVSRIVIGVDSPVQLQDVSAAFEKARVISFDAGDLDIADVDIVDPRRWRN